MNATAPFPGAVARPASTWAAYGADGFHLERGGRILPKRAPANLGELAYQASTIGVSRLFVAEDGREALGLPISLAGEKPRHPFVSGPPGFDVGAGLAPILGVRLPASLREELAGRPARVSVVFCSWDDSPLRRALTGRTTAAALRRLQGELGLAWRGAGATAETLIASTHPARRGGRVIRRPEAPPPPAEAGNTETAYTWRRALTSEEASRGYVHVFDKNGQYLAAWSSLSVGLEGLEHLLPVSVRGPAGEWVSRLGFDPSLPGYWRLALPGGPELLPPVGSGSREWHHTEAVKLAAELGPLPPIAEAYVWREHSRYLEGSYRRLRDARTRLIRATEPAAAIALACVKRMYAVEYGRFGAGFRFARPDRWLRPEWRHGTIALARANLYRGLARIAREHRRRPFAIEYDAVAYASHSPDAAAFAARVGLPLGVELGQWKHVATAPMTPAFAGRGSARSVIALVKGASP
jgi:hypothetical protein